MPNQISNKLIDISNKTISKLCRMNLNPIAVWV